MKQVFKIGDSVKAKKGVTYSNVEDVCLEGWQGRVVEITTESPNKLLLDIRWDSITLQNMPEHFIEKCEEDGLDCTLCGLYADEVELASPRDTETYAQKTAALIEKSHCWSFLGEQGKRIRKILGDIEKMKMAKTIS